MPFVSPLFLFLYLPLFFAFYYAVPRRLHNGVICVASVVFYAWGAPRFAPILLATSCLDYFLSRKMYRQPQIARLLLTASLILNLSLLFYFKYINFFISQLIAAGLPIENDRWNTVLLPLGISFFTFHKLSYLIDVYRRDVPPAESLVDFLVYILLFPQLIAGPIVRYHELSPQLSNRSISREGISGGIRLFCIGLGKKALIADYLSPIADLAFGPAAAGLTPAEAWLGLLAYALQIYFDFSGYSDMARGLAEMLGFHFPLNFNQPYLALSITDFWRRWHMTLSAWMKNYLYIPLGGNRRGPVRSALNLWIVFLLSGLWHGAQWTFIGWGAYHGLFLTLDKLFLLRRLQQLPLLFQRAATFFIVCMGWVLFRAENFSAALLYYQALFPLHFAGAALPSSLFADISMRSWAMLGAGALFAVWRSKRLLDSWTAALLLYLLSVFSLVNASFSPFIYFRF